MERRPGMTKEHVTTRQDESMEERRPWVGSEPVRARGAWRRRIADRPMRAWTIVVAVLYAALVVGGITTTSVGFEPLRDELTSTPDGLIAGKPRAIRSDEALRSTPWTIGVLERSGDAFTTPLTYRDASLVAPGGGGPVTKLLFLESTVFDLFGSTLTTQAFAAIWWFVTAVVLLLLPRWFARLGVPPSVGIPLTVLVVASPATAWWSWSSLTPLCWALVAAMGTLGVHRLLTTRVGRARLWALVPLVVGAAGFARMSLSYQPWAVPIALTVLVPTLVFLLTTAEAPRRVGLLCAGAVVLAGGAAFSLYYREHATSLGVLADTVYPGSRRNTGSPASLAQLFGAPHMWVLQRTPALVNTNQSEISSSYLILGLVAALLAPAIDWRRRTSGCALAVTTLVVLGVLASWCMVAWPDGASKLFPMSLVAPLRLAQVLGFTAIIAFGFVFTAWGRDRIGSRRATAGVVGAATFLLTAYAGSGLRVNFLPGYRTPWIGLTSLVVTAVVVCAVLAGRRSWALVPMVVAALPVVLFANPVQHGFGDLTTGTNAAKVRSISATFERGQLWATDDFYADALLMANSEQALSGQQWVGPDVDAWKRLDPTGASKDAWNRGASYILFGWAPAGGDTRITAAQADIIRVDIDPCSPTLDAFDLGAISANHTLDGDCLTEVGRLDLGGIDRWVYRVDG
ncbi:MAG: hypothetical protein JWN72_640 [Thermoleophilia bacterium]|nr:hypothetical protein [Thermoleophilia bacterium]